MKLHIQPVFQALVVTCSLSVAALLVAQTSKPDGPLELTAVTANVGGAPDQVRLEILRWSTNEERSHLLDAWNLKVEEPPARGKGGAKGGAGKGKGRGGPAAEPEKLTPEASLAKALEEAPTVGYVWSSEVAGYSLRYAGRVPNADGSQRLILITQRRLGASNQLWKPAQGTPNDEEFTVIELHLNAKNEGEGKASLTGGLAPDSAAQIVTVQNYASLPVVFQNVKPQAAQVSKK